MDKKIMIKHYEATPKDTLIDILVASREQVEKLQQRNKECKQEIERLNNIINELEKDIENKITFCSNEANGSINNKLCKISIQYLEHLKNKLQELKGDESNGR